MYYIEKIDKDIYKCVSDNIVTDDVIITDERFEHIKERHPNDYENCIKYIAEMVTKPQYIIEANKPNSAVILNSFDDGRFKAILKMHTVYGDSDFKNSIITFLKIKDKEWVRLLKNKKILYKSE